jgi:hypothetical protein
MARLDPPGTIDEGGPIPPGNRAGHHPDVDQDKPTGPPPRPTSAARSGARRGAARASRSTRPPSAGARRFPFAYSGRAGWLARRAGLGEGRAYVELDGDTLTVRFGPWVVRTERSNVAAAEITGPYAPWRVLGTHLSLADRGLSFGTDTRRGVCLRFHEPVTGIDPLHRLRHPGLTVTVQEPEELVAEFNAA